jgi:excinuclease ABC subunit B
MERAIEETERRRARQIAHNEEHGITPTALNKKVRDIIEDAYASGGHSGQKRQRKVAETAERFGKETVESPAEAAKRIEELEKKMLEHARNLEFEEAARLRDEVARLREVAFIS